MQYVHRYVHARMIGGPLAARAAADSVVARAAELRWTALNRAFGDERVGTWAWSRQPDQIHVPAALIAAAGVARLTRCDDAKWCSTFRRCSTRPLQLCEPAGNA